MKAFGLIILILAILAVVGYVKNIVKLMDCDFVAPYKCEVVHGMGVIPVIGAITGWITIEGK